MPPTPVDRGRDPQGVERASIVEPEHVGALGHRQRGRRGGGPLPLDRWRPALPRTGQHGAQEVLAGQRHEQGPAQGAKPAEPGEDPQIVLDREVEVEPGIERDLLLGDPVPDRGLDPVREPADEVTDGVRVARGLPVRPRRSLDVHEDVAASPLGDQAPHLRVPPPEMSLIATAPASSARRATSGWKVSALSGTPAPRASPSTAGISRAASSSTDTGAPLAAGTAPTSSRSKPGRASARPSLDRPLGRRAARALEERVGASR